MKNRVLFIGNSHTFVQNLPWLFAAVCKQAGREVEAFMLTYPGCDLSWHLKSLCALPNIRFGGYDYVVLQQKSHPFDGADALIEQALPLIKAITDAGAVTILMNTWSEENNPEGQQTIDDAFTALQARCPGSAIARCGGAWHKLRGVLGLYAHDGAHMNTKGAYLNACVLAKTIFGIDPLTLEPRIETDAITRELPEEELRLLQKTAASV